MDADVAEAAPCGPLQQTAEVIEVAMHAAVGAEADQMERAAVDQQGVGQRIECGIGGKAAVFHRLANANQLLTDDPPAADGEVAHFRVAHLAVGQAHIAAARLDEGVGVGLPERIHHRGAGGADRIVIAGFAVSPAIENGQHHW